MGHGKRAVDYGFAEALAFGSVLLEGNPVRLTGQDSERGTFNQRHAVLVDTETEEEYCSLAHLAPDQPFCEFTTLRSPKPAASASNMASAATTLKLWFCGKRSSEILPTALR